MIINDCGNMCCPWAIAFDSDGMWAVTSDSYDCVYIFDGQDQLVGKFGSSGKRTGPLVIIQNYFCTLTAKLPAVKLYSMQCSIRMYLLIYFI